MAKVRDAFVQALIDIGVRRKDAYKIHYAVDRLQLQDCRPDDLAALIWIARGDIPQVIGLKSDDELAAEAAQLRLFDGVAVREVPEGRHT